MKDAYVEFDAITFRNARDLRMRGTGILNQENRPRCWKVRIQATQKKPTESGLYPQTTTWITCNEPRPFRSLYPHIMANLRDANMHFSDYSKIMIRIMRA
jgi:hypothetical protein